MFFSLLDSAPYYLHLDGAMRFYFFLMILACGIAKAAEPAWLPFEWVNGSWSGGPPERLGMLVPVTVNGVACTVQLDTGANGEWNWKRRGAATARDQRAAVEVAGLRRAIPASVDNLAQLKEADCGGTPIAIVGNALFENGTLTLDLGRSRYAYSAEPLLANVRQAQPLLYLSWSTGGGHIAVEVRRPGGGIAYAMLDTGAARFGLVATDAQEWQALTQGAAKPALDPVAFNLSGPEGEAVRCNDALLDGELEVGGRKLSGVRASYCAGHSFKAPVRFIGTLGMAPLGNRTVVLDYPSRRWTLSER